MKTKNFSISSLSILVLILLSSCGSGDAVLENSNYISYENLVNRLMDMRALATLPEEGEESEMWSSYDRKSRIDSVTGEYMDWAANIDGLEPQYIRKEGDQEVLAEMEGPGAIVRIWSASPKQGHVRIFIDGEEIPLIDQPFIDYFSSAVPAFNFDQLVYETSAKGFNNYVPIPYNESCKIVADPGWGQYYQFNYISFPEGTQLEELDPDLRPEQKSALGKVNQFFEDSLGASPYPNDNFIELTKEVRLQPGERSTVFDIPGSGAISGLKIRIKDRDSLIVAELLRKTTIEMRWDGSQQPAVWSPLGDFFGTSPGWNEYKTLPMGMTEDWMYSYWYMPFSDGAEIIIENEFDQPVALELEIKHEEFSENPEGLGRFHAKWHRDLEPVSKDRWPDWKLLETQGRGRFVGTHLLVWNPKGGSCSLGGPGYYWWGEGDEKFFIDGEKFPSLFGTGTEDYFGYAWCDPSEFQRAFHSQSLDNDNMGYQPMNRWHIIDNIPFQESFEGYLEKYFPNEWPTQYSTVVYWYLAPNGIDNLGEVPVAERYGYEIPYKVFRKDQVVEGENLNLEENTGGWATTDAFSHEDLYKEVSGHKMLLWFTDPNRQNRLSTNFFWPESGKYEVYANLIKSKDGGSFGIRLNENEFRTINTRGEEPMTTERVKLGEIELAAGPQELQIMYAGSEKKNPHALRLDYLEFVPIPQ